ncbi:hypothetical protein ABKN59_011994 [Abortiporus biennis]
MSLVTFERVILGKYLLLFKSTNVTREHGARIMDQLSDALQNNLGEIRTKLKYTPDDYILLEGLHQSPGDPNPNPHYTIDAYVKDPVGSDKDIPFGCIHVSEDFIVNPFQGPRKGAHRVYLKKFLQSD